MYIKEYFINSEQPNQNYTEQPNQNNNSNNQNNDVNDIDIREMRKINICDDKNYNTFVYLILGGIIIFFIWHMITSPFIKEDQLTKTSTPFTQ